MTVELIDYMGSDLRIVDAMLVSTGKDLDREGEPSEADKGRINRLVRDHHASPFEHCVMTVRVETPIFVAREWFRHRTHSYNEFSQRYATIDQLGTDMTFYLPAVEDMRTQVGKGMDYHYEPLDEELAEELRHALTLQYENAQETYEALLEDGLAKELARLVLPMATMTRFYDTCNLRNWFNFLVLRNEEHAQREIRYEAEQIETLIEELWPVAYEKWNEHGRPQI